MWGSPAIQVPIEIDKDSNSDGDGPDEDDVPKLPWGHAELSESWWSVLHGFTDEQWTRFVPENPLKPRPPATRGPMGPGRVLWFRKRG
jgi:hypothetical protein